MIVEQSQDAVRQLRRSPRTVRRCTSRRDEKHLPVDVEPCCLEVEAKTAHKFSRRAGHPKMIQGRHHTDEAASPRAFHLYTCNMSECAGRFGVPRLLSGKRSGLPQTRPSGNQVRLLLDLCLPYRVHRSWMRCLYHRGKSVLQERAREVDSRPESTVRTLRQLA